MKIVLVGVLGLLLGSVVAAIATTSAVADNRLDNNGHWGRVNSEWPAHVTLIDHTGPAWPVGTAVLDWDQADNIDVDYQTPGDCDHHCTPVRAYDWQDDPQDEFLPYCGGVVGRFWFDLPLNSNNHWNDQGERVDFNRECADESNSWRRAFVCQEVGHVLGLDHAVAESCMHQDPSEAASTPRPHDYEMLDDHIYDH